MRTDTVTSSDFHKMVHFIGHHRHAHRVIQLPLLICID
jgi:hypothetical protein